MKIISSLALLAVIAVISCKENPSETQVQETSVSRSETPLLATIAPETTAPEKQILYVTAPSGLSLRSGITLRSEKKLTLPYGAQVTHLSTPDHTSMTIDGLEGDMVELVYQGATGFAFSGYLSTLAPPLQDEQVKDYAARISTETMPVEVVKTPHAKGAAYGLTTSIEIPAKHWNEAYTIAKALFQLPKSLRLDLSQKNGKDYLENKNKLRKTLVDEVQVNRDSEGSITSVVYTYKLKTYNRQVSITKSNTGFLLNEVEQSE